MATKPSDDHGSCGVFKTPLRLQDSMQTGSRFPKTIKSRQCSSQAKKGPILRFLNGRRFAPSVPFGEDGAIASYILGFLSPEVDNVIPEILRVPCLLKLLFGPATLKRCPMSPRRMPAGRRAAWGLIQERLSFEYFMGFTVEYLRSPAGGNLRLGELRFWSPQSP